MLVYYMEMTINLDDFSAEMINGLTILRDGSRCQHRENGIQCKGRYPLEVHHIIHKEDGGDDSPDNLTTLCTKHHRLSHKKDGKQLFIKGIVDENYIPYGLIASLLGLTQPAVSILLLNGSSGLETAIRIKVIINSILKTDYTVEQLFARTGERPALLGESRLYDLVKALNSTPKARRLERSRTKPNNLCSAERLRKTWDERYADKGGVSHLWEMLKTNKAGTLQEAAKHFGVSRERIRQVKILLFPKLATIHKTKDK